MSKQSQWDRPGYREAFGLKMKELWTRPGHREKMGRIQAKKFEDPEYRARMMENLQAGRKHGPLSEEQKVKLRASWARKKEEGTLPPHLLDGSLDKYRHGTLTCPRCGKVGGYIIMCRHHGVNGENCRKVL